MGFTLGMTGPITVADYREFIDPGQWHDRLPKGLGGTPVNLLCRELLRRGQRLVIFSTDPGIEREVVLEGERLRICIGPEGPRPARSFFRASRGYLARAIARERPDVLHAQWTYEFALPVQASGIPHVITAHDAPINILRHNPIPFRVARTLMAYRVLTRARRAVSVSPYIREHIARFMGYRGSGEVIPNGVPEELFAAEATRDAGQPPTFATILTGWGKRKNGEVAIEAFAQVRAALPEARLLMFGYDFGAGETAQHWARSRRLDAGIEFVGMLAYADMTRRLRQEVDVLVHPALEESFGMTFIEAMALRIPAIGGQASGAVPWVLEHGKAGLLVDVRNPAAVAQAMLGLASDRAERMRIGRMGYESARRRFHIATVAEAYQAIYAELAGGRA